MTNRQRNFAEEAVIQSSLRIGPAAGEKPLLLARMRPAQMQDKALALHKQNQNIEQRNVGLVGEWIRVSFYAFIDNRFGLDLGLNHRVRESRNLTTYDNAAESDSISFRAA